MSSASEKALATGSESEPKDGALTPEKADNVAGLRSEQLLAKPGKDGLSTSKGTSNASSKGGRLGLPVPEKIKKVDSCPLNQHGWTHTCEPDLRGKYQDNVVCQSPFSQAIGTFTGADVRAGISALRAQDGSVGEFEGKLLGRLGFLLEEDEDAEETTSDALNQVETTSGENKNTAEVAKRIRTTVNVSQIGDEKLYQWPSAEGHCAPGKWGCPVSFSDKSVVQEKLENVDEDAVVVLQANLHRVVSYDAHDAMLFLSCRSVRHLALVRPLLEVKANAAYQDRFGHTCLHQAVTRCSAEGDAETICFLPSFQAMQARHLQDIGCRNVGNVDPVLNDDAATTSEKNEKTESRASLTDFDTDVHAEQPGEEIEKAVAEAAGDTGEANVLKPAGDNNMAEQQRAVLSEDAGGEPKEGSHTQAEGGDASDETAGSAGEVVLAADGTDTPPPAATGNAGQDQVTISKASSSAPASEAASKKNADQATATRQGDASQPTTFLDVVQLLLQNKASANHPVFPPLLDCKSVRCLRLLLDAKASLLVQRSSEEIMQEDSALHCYAMRNDRAMVWVLLKEAEKRGQLKQLAALKDLFGQSAASAVQDEYVGQMVVQAGCEIIEDWVSPLNKDGDHGHPCERIRIAARIKFRYVTRREADYQMRLWRKENPDWRRWSIRQAKGS
ncbi:unnamed protein product [Amoebophrya sp. A120]|nr:unnamed protein product [Amoebophrya sp. A120]|eukprot:GSA120T00003336001.1